MAVTSYTRNYHTMTLALAGLYTVNAVYDVTVKAKVGGVFGSAGSVCSLTAPATAPETSVMPTYCGTTMASFTSPFYCDPVQGATGYEFEFTNTTTNAVTTNISTGT